MEVPRPVPNEAETRPHQVQDVVNWKRSNRPINSTRGWRLVYNRVMNWLIILAVLLNCVVFYLIVSELPSLVVEIGKGKPSWIEQKIIDREEERK